MLENFNESAIRGWFSQFGPLNQVIIDHTWGKAILVYADYDSAAKAWNDPRPVFSNRFVKIWWKKMPQTTSISTPPPNNAGGNGTLSGAIVDQVELEIAKEAAMKAQKEHEEKQKRKEELEKKKEELERQRVKLLERQKQEREKLMEKIRRAEEKKKNKDVTNGSSASASPQQPQKDQSVTPVPEDVSKKETTNGTEQPADESSERKAHLQKMLTDLQNQVYPHHHETSLTLRQKPSTFPPQSTPSPHSPTPPPAPKPPSAAHIAVVPTSPADAAGEDHPDP